MDRYPYTNFHELNLVYFLRHFKEIFDQWASLYEEMTSWKASTTEELDAWKAEVLGDIDQWETDLNAALALWKTDTEADISAWESSTMAALEAWQTAFETLFSSTFSDLSDIKTAAEAAQAAAEAAAAAAEAAAASVESSAAQITANTTDIVELKIKAGYAVRQGLTDTTWNANRFINYHTGTAGVASSGDYIASTYIPIPEGAKDLDIAMPIVGVSSNGGIAFYTTNAQAGYISGAQMDNGSSYEYGWRVYHVEIPADAVYLRTTWYASGGTYGEFYNNYSLVFNIPGTLDEDVENIYKALSVQQNTIINSSYPDGMSPIAFSWEPGLITSGSDADGAGLRTKGYLEFFDDLVIKCESGYTVTVVAYNWDGTSYSFVSNLASGVSEYETLHCAVNATYLRFVLVKTGGNITIDEVTNITIRAYTNATQPYFNNPIFNNVCHRGYNKVAPENTIPAFDLARKMGFRIIESDVQFTSDDVPVMLHDRSVSRTSNGTGNVDEMTYQDIRALDFGSWKNPVYTGTKIPSFEEFLAWLKKTGCQAYIELKSDVNYSQANIESLVDLVYKYHVEDFVSWIGFSDRELAFVHAKDTGARIGYLVTGSITSAKITTAQALGNNVFLLCYSSSHTFDDSTLPLAIAAGIPVETCLVDTDALLEDMSPIYSGNVTNGYPTDRKMLLA